jgi:LL-diaminopimelate aminotransferase
MIQCNENYLKLQGRYLFREIDQRVREFHEAKPNKKIISLGIGDVTRPLTPAVIEAMHEAVNEMADPGRFRGYGPEQGYGFLREAIFDNDYYQKGIHVELDEIFISDGSKCDTANILDVISQENSVALTDPVYPVYVDTNVMAGRTGDADAKGQYEGIHYLPCTADNGFVPPLPDRKVDMIYLCYPNNPTGTTLTRKQLKQWVDYALESMALILFDAAYESYIREPRIPHSIYEIEGARKVAIEFRSFSKTAGFTGVRCAFAVVPKDLVCFTRDNRQHRLRDLWSRRQSTKFNGVSYITQRAAEAVYSIDGREETRALVDYYLENADIIRDTLSSIGLEVYGGVNAPYVWVRTPDNMESWDYFQKALEEMYVVVTPGSGFGPSGEGYVRFSAFASREDVEEAMHRFRKSAPKVA